MTKLLQSQISKLKELNNLFIELTAKNCNQRCKNCYIDFPISKNIKDFIPDDLIKETLMQTKNENIECIYLTGAEPMTHPDFNGILRMCLKRTNVCICTNGSFINEKKARFLKRVEDESDYEIIFQLGTAHYDEIKNDDHLSKVEFRINLRPSSIKVPDTYKGTNWDKEIENRKSSTRCKVEHPFLIVKRQFGYAKVAYRGIAKNMNRFHILFASANLVMCARAGRSKEFCMA